MKKIAMIPARYAATRFPFKLMQPLGNKSVIRQTYDNAIATGLFDAVYVVTDHEIIFNEITGHGGKAIMSKKPHESGSDRIAEAVKDMDAEVIVNIQGDEPFVPRQPLHDLLAVFDKGDGKVVQVASLMKAFADQGLVADPNYVKVVANRFGDALFFSRSPLPYKRDENIMITYYEHIGVYAFRKHALMEFTAWPPGILEQAEKLEQLRYLENGISIRMVETNMTTVKIDVPADLAIAEDYLRNSIFTPDS